MNAIITGGTGMIGSLVLDQCLSSDKIKQVISLVRRGTSRQHSKLKEVVITNFADYREQQALFQDVGLAFFCLGAYTGQIPPDEFKIITVDYAVAFAKALYSQSPSANLCLLSGAGADRTEKSRTSFARFKGMAENQIAALGISFFAFRPGYIYPVEKRNEPNLMYRVSRRLYPVIRLFGNNASIKSTALAAAMFNVGMSGADHEILENRDILKYV